MRKKRREGGGKEKYDKGGEVEDVQNSKKGKQEYYSREV